MFQFYLSKLISEYAVYYPEVENYTSSVWRLDVSESFSSGKDVFTLDGLLILDFPIMRNPFMAGYGEEGFDYSELKNIEKEYQSRVIFLDTNGAKSFVLEISPVFLTLSFKSDYIWVNRIYFLYLYRLKGNTYVRVCAIFKMAIIHLFLGLCRRK